MVVDDGAGEQRGQWRGSMDRTGQAKDGDGDDDDDDDDDDKNESDETLSLSYLPPHDEDTAALCSGRARLANSCRCTPAPNSNRSATTMAAAVRSHRASQDRRHYALASHGTHAFASARVLDL